MGDGKPLGTAQADENGEWTFATEHQFASADPKLALVVKSAAEVAQAAKEATDRTKVASAEQREAAPATAPPERPSAKRRNHAPPEGPGRHGRGRALSAAASHAGGHRKASDRPTGRPAAAGCCDAAGRRTAGRRTAGKRSGRDSATLPAEQVAPSTTVAAAGPQNDTAQQKTVVPVPITFVFNEASFTDPGKKAAALLLEYLRLKHFKSVSLTGHADERGTESST